MCQGTARPAEARRAFEEGLEIVRRDRHLSGDQEFLRTLHWHLSDIDRNTGDYAHRVNVLRELLRLYPEGHAEWHRILIWLGRTSSPQLSTATCLDYTGGLATRITACCCVRQLMIGRMRQKSGNTCPVTARRCIDSWVGIRCCGRGPTAMPGIADGER